MKPLHETDQVLVDITISAPIDQVWRALREPEAIANWFGWEHETLAQEIDAIFLTSVQADEQTHSLRFAEWEALSHRLELSPLAGPSAQTRLRLVISGAPDLDWDGVYEDMREGWVSFFQQLRFGMDQHPGQRRRSLCLSGALRSGAGTLLEQLGLQELRSKQAGDRFRLQTEFGELSGQIWHRTQFQIGLSVAQWGEALLVLTEKGRSAASLILNSYDLDDDTQSRLQERWQAWWQQHYQVPSASVPDCSSSPGPAP